MNMERFKTVAAAIGFQPTEDEPAVWNRDDLPLEQFIALIEKMKKQGFNLMEIEFSFADENSDDVISLSHDPDDGTAFMELLLAEELTES